MMERENKCEERRGGRRKRGKRKLFVFSLGTVWFSYFLVGISSFISRFLFLRCLILIIRGQDQRETISLLRLSLSGL